MLRKNMGKNIYISQILKFCMQCIHVDPYQWKFPEIVDEHLHHGTTKCIAFNHTGTLLAVNYLSLLLFKLIQVMFCVAIFLVLD
jgi:hypothetical protein